MKKLLLLASLIILLGSGFCGSLLMNAMAEDKDGYQPVVFYKSVEISEGDTLWSIAEEYAPDLELNVFEYIECLKQMNRLDEDIIHAGRHLTVMYNGAVG